jgi:hypothetical protein
MNNGGLLKDFGDILKELGTNNKEIIFKLNPFFLKFIEAELKTHNIATDPDRIQSQINDYLFTTFTDLPKEDKLFILFSYVILNSLLEKLNLKEKEGLIKVIDNSILSGKSHDYSSYEVLLDLNVISIDKSVLIKIVDFSVEEEYKKVTQINLDIKSWIVKSVIITVLGVSGILTVLFLIPATHNYIFGNAVEIILTKFSEIMALIFSTK